MRVPAASLKAIGAGECVRNGGLPARGYGLSNHSVR